MKLEVKDLFEGYGLNEVDMKIYPEIFEMIWKMFSCAYENVDEAHNQNHVYHVLRRAVKMVFWLKNNTRNFNHDKETKYILKVILASIVHDVYSYTKRKKHHEEAYLLIRKLVSLKVLEHSKNMNVKDKAIAVSNQKMEILESIPVNNIKNMTTNSDIEFHYDFSKFDWLKYFSSYDLLEVSNMVNEHRASYNGSFTSELCELFSCADRDDLDLNIIINRIYNCSKDDKCTFEYDIHGNRPLDIFINNVSYHSLEIIPYLEKTLEWDNMKIKTFYHLWEKFSRVGYMFENLPLEGFYFKYYKNNIEEFYSQVDDIIINPEKLLSYLKV